MNQPFMDKPKKQDLQTMSKFLGIYLDQQKDLYEQYRETKDRRYAEAANRLNTEVYRLESWINEIIRTHYVSSQGSR